MGKVVAISHPFTMQQDSASALQPDEFFAPSSSLRQAVAYVCERDRAFKKIEATVGPLTVRSWAPGFPSLVRIVVGQQLSARAAQAIFQRLQQQIELTPQQFAATSDITLQQVGFSRAKIATCQRLAEAILADHLNLDTFPLLPDAAIVEQLT